MTTKENTGNLLDVKCDKCQYELKNTNTLYRDENEQLSIKMKVHEREHHYTNTWSLTRHE